MEDISQRKKRTAYTKWGRKNVEQKQNMEIYLKLEIVRFSSVYGKFPNYTNFAKENCNMETHGTRVSS